MPIHLKMMITIFARNRSFHLAPSATVGGAWCSFHFHRSHFDVYPMDRITESSLVTYSTVLNFCGTLSRGPKKEKLSSTKSETSYLQKKVMRDRISWKKVVTSKFGFGSVLVRIDGPMGWYCVQRVVPAGFGVEFYGKSLFGSCAFLSPARIVCFRFRLCFRSSTR